MHPLHPLLTTTLTRLQALWQLGTDPLQLLNHLRSPALLLTRLYVAQVFFMAGLTKIRDWGSTLDLFTYEYAVPLLPPYVAAVLGTAGELVLPVLLVMGLCGRLAALGLSVVNIVAVISLTDIAPAALQQHIFWGWLLAFIAIMGTGRWAMDSWLGHRLQTAQ